VRSVSDLASEVAPHVSCPRGEGRTRVKKSPNPMGSPLSDHGSPKGRPDEAAAAWSEAVEHLSTRPAPAHIHR
jgi:hypothetical protein